MGKLTYLKSLNAQNRNDVPKQETDPWTGDILTLKQRNSGMKSPRIIDMISTFFTWLAAVLLPRKFFFKCMLNVFYSSVANLKIMMKITTMFFTGL